MAARKSRLAWAKWLSLPIGLALLLLVLLLLTPAAPEAPPAAVPLEQTLAYRMLQRERAVRDVPASAEPLLRKVLSGAMEALGPDPAPPATADEFRAFAEKVSVVLAAHNFVQPGSTKDWPDTLGEAFAPLARSDPRVASSLRADQPARLRHLKPEGPVYFVDCDIGAMLIVSVAQMVGFDVAMVEVPGHNFMRWKSPSAATASWDWTYWRAPDEAARASRLQSSLLTRNVFLASQTLEETEAYFKSVLAGELDDQPAKMALRREAAAAFPNNRVVAYGVARTFALSPAASPAERREALGYSLLALSMEGNGSSESLADRMMAVACAYAANGEPALAKAFTARARTLADIDKGYGGSIADVRAERACPP
ncbi:MAG TPA: hypothetical protein VK403_14205 [Allosphingosinicella sp.]|nr:hypothetical protein [Allosphingosinicella sp.]